MYYLKYTTTIEISNLSLHDALPISNLELSAVVPVTRNFGFTASGLISRTINNGPGITQDWVPTVAAQSANFPATTPDRKSTRLNSSHLVISYAVFCLKKI